MLTKLLLTLLVIVACVLLLQRRRRRRAAPPVAAPSRRPSRWRWVLLALLGLLLLGGASLALREWQEQRTLLAVRVINPLTGAEQHYRAYRGALQGRRFTTVDGLEVQLSDTERVEVQELVGQ